MITGVRDIFYMLFLVCLLMAESARAQTSDTINGGRLNDDSAVVMVLADDAGKMKAPKKKRLEHVEAGSEKSAVACSGHSGRRTDL